MIEAIVIIVSITFVVTILTIRSYKKTKGIPLDECNECKSKGKELVKWYKKTCSK